MPDRNSQRGSVLIYIFVAIAVLTALTFAVTRGNREGVGTIDRERSDLHATQILDYTGMIRRAVQGMRVAGIPETSFCFHSTAWDYTSYDYAACTEPANQIFLPRGGGASFQTPSESLLDRNFRTEPRWGDWNFTGVNRIEGVGEDCSTPDGECNELLLLLPYIRPEVCMALNKRLHVGSATEIPTGDLKTDDFYTGIFPTGPILNASELKGKRSGCYKTTSLPVAGTYVFFAVLVAR